MFEALAAPRKATIAASFSRLSTLDRGSFGPIRASVLVWRERHFCTVVATPSCGGGGLPFDTPEGYVPRIKTRYAACRSTSVHPKEIGCPCLSKAAGVQLPDLVRFMSLAAWR